MSETETETALCIDCSVPVEMPPAERFGPFLVCQPTPICKDCQLTRSIAFFEMRHRLLCPYKLPHWRPPR